MENPYASVNSSYGHLAGSFNDLTKTLLQMKGQEMQNALSLAEMEMRGNQFNQNKDLEQRKLAVAESNLDPEKKPLSRAELIKTKIGIKNSIGFSDKDIDDIYSPIMEMAGAPRGQAYDTLRTQGPQLREALIGRLQQAYEKRLSSDAMFPGSKQEKAMMALMQSLDADPDFTKHIDEMFPDITRTRKIAAENSKLALAQATSAQKIAMAQPDIQFMMNRTQELINSGMPQETAVSKAYKELKDLEAKTKLAGRTNVTVNAPTSSQIDVLAKGILDGTIDPNGVSKRGGLQGAVWAKVKEYNPQFNLVDAGANAKFKQATGTMQTKALLNTIEPLLDQLDTAGSVLGNSNIVALNKARNFLKEQTGSDDIVGFNNLRDAVVAEVERGLMGTGVLSDSKYQRELKNLHSAQSYNQLKAAIANTKKVIRARLEAIEAGPTAKTPAQSATQNNKIGRFTVEVE